MSLFLSLFFFATFTSAAEVSFTMDDPEVSEGLLFSAKERNQKILESFDHFKVQAALFVCGMRVDSTEGAELLRSWDKKGHIISNHSYSHLYYPSQKQSFESFRDDFLKVEPVIKESKNFKKIFRFPYLKEGNTKEKRDQMRAELKKHGYQQGYVTIDASDWYVDLRLRDRLKKDPKSDLKPYRDFYLKHIWDRAQFYDNIAKKVFGREIKHTLLIHHNLLNALFLKDLMQMFQDKGWKLISAEKAFQDPVFQQLPQILPAGESIVWAAAKESGKFEDQLRYPGEDGEYEKNEMDQKGL